ncbi:MAG: ABC transporter permease subunit [Christensenellales bacterium]
MGDKGFITTQILNSTGEYIDFYKKPEAWKAILVVAGIWKNAGVSVIVYYATLMAIDNEIMEAAEIDGAGRWKKMFYISLPHLRLMIILNIIMSSANILRYDFSMVYFLTNNSPILYKTTDTLETYMFRALRTNGDFSIGTATGLAQGVAGLILSYFTNKLAKKVDKAAAIY